MNVAAEALWASHVAELGFSNFNVLKFKHKLFVEGKFADVDGLSTWTSEADIGAG